MRLYAHYRETLIRIAKETAQKRALSDPGLVAAYLTGSLRTDNPFLGNATDIDIVFVHAGQPESRREIIPLTPEIHLDIRTTHAVITINRKNCASIPGWDRNSMILCRSM